MADTNRNPWFALVRDSAFVAAIVAGVAGAWVIADALGDLEAQLARAGAKDEHLAVLIDRNVKAIDRNVKAIDRNAEAIDRNAEAIDRNAEAMERVFEAIDRNAKAIDRNMRTLDRVFEAIDRNAEAIDRNVETIDRNAVAIGELKESVASLTGQYTEHTRKHEELAGR